MIQKTITIAGGDLRQLTVAQEFSNADFKVTLCGFDKAKDLPKGIIHKSDFRSALSGSNFIVLPLPFSRDGENVSSPLSNKLLPLKLIEEACTDKIVFGGMLGKRALGKETIDYYENEELKIFNYT